MYTRAERARGRGDPTYGLASSRHGAQAIIEKRVRRFERKWVNAGPDGATDKYKVLRWTAVGEAPTTGGSRHPNIVPVRGANAAPISPSLRPVSSSQRIDAAQRPRRSTRSTGNLEEEEPMIAQIPAANGGNNAAAAAAAAVTDAGAAAEEKEATPAEEAAAPAAAAAAAGGGGGGGGEQQQQQPAEATAPSNDAPVPMDASAAANEEVAEPPPTTTTA